MEDSSYILFHLDAVSSPAPKTAPDCDEKCDAGRAESTTTVSGRTANTTAGVYLMPKH